MFAQGKESLSLEYILNRVTEYDILSFYLNITTIPCTISSPLRYDKNPSFRLFSPDGKKIKYKDFSTKDSGSIFDLLMGLWKISYYELLSKLYKDLDQIQHKNNIIKNIIPKKIHSIKDSNIEIKCKIRDWKDYDIEYWNSYGIDIKWLKYCEIYPISHKFITINNKTYTFGTDKHAYAYIEHKENKTTIKIYQPFNKNGYKWSTNHDSSVISLWTKIPKEGNILCICASVKDALCLWSNTGIPSIALQGEGYNISNTALNNLKARYKEIYIFFDNDKPGIEDAIKLSNVTGLKYITLPKFEEYNNPKDISDLYKSIQNKEKFKELILKLF